MKLKIDFGYAFRITTIFAIFDLFYMNPLNQAIKKPDRQLMHIGLNQSVIKAGDGLIMIFFELLYSD